MAFAIIYTKSNKNNCRTHVKPRDGRSIIISNASSSCARLSDQSTCRPNRNKSHRQRQDKPGSCVLGAREFYVRCILRARIRERLFKECVRHTRTLYALLCLRQDTCSIAGLWHASPEDRVYMFVCNNHVGRGSSRCIWTRILISTPHSLRARIFQLICVRFVGTWNRQERPDASSPFIDHRTMPLFTHSMSNVQIEVTLSQSSNAEVVVAIRTNESCSSIAIGYFEHEGRRHARN